MSTKPQTATELSRTLAGQWSKSEKRSQAFRDITKYKQMAYQKTKEVLHGLKFDKS
jgi:hypothetical protein